MSVNVVVTIQQVCAAAGSGQGLSRLRATTLQRWRLGSEGGCCCDVQGLAIESVVRIIIVTLISPWTLSTHITSQLGSLRYK